MATIHNDDCSDYYGGEELCNCAVRVIDKLSAELLTERETGARIHLESFVGYLLNQTGITIDDADYGFVESWERDAARIKELIDGYCTSLALAAGKTPAQIHAELAAAQDARADERMRGLREENVRLRALLLSITQVEPLGDADSTSDIVGLRNGLLEQILQIQNVAQQALASSEATGEDASGGEEEK
jgi:hypothetical protein